LDKVPAGTLLRLGGMTDCFQPIERKHRITYEVIRELNKRKIGYLIVTKSAMAADDEYIRIYDPELAHIQVTITATDDSRALEYEKADATSDRIKAIEKQVRGLDVAVRLSPFMPEFIDFDILNSIYCDKILVEFLRCNAFIRRNFPLDYSDYTVKQGGYRHLPPEKKRYWLSKVSGFREITVCEDESEAYEYWKRHMNHDPEDCCNLRKTGR
jgi:DNA repair photolyase